MDGEISIFNPKLYQMNYLQCQRGFKTKERLAAMPYFLYVHKGKGTFIIGENQYSCEAGDLFFCPCGETNTIIADMDHPYLLSGVDFEFCENNPAFFPPFGYQEHINVRGNEPFLWLTMELIRRDCVVDKDYEEYKQSLFRAWLLLVARISDESKNPTIAEKAAAYLVANRNRSVSLTEMAEEFKYHPNYINRVFKKRYGITLLQFHLDLRMKDAMQLLSYTNYSIGEISELCGFEDMNYFSRIFKKKTAMSPLKYRNGWLKGERNSEMG